MLNPNSHETCGIQPGQLASRSESRTIDRALLNSSFGRLDMPADFPEWSHGIA
jgi:hypothetical protein